MTFPDFFKTATGKPAPYDYQQRLASLPCESRLISIPTGLGKTAAVTLSWLWNRVHNGKTDWPRRLVYCLPMRTLVEQTRDEAADWMKKHGLLWDEKSSHQGKVGLHILMGGEDAGEWDIHPEREAILIGTQDMLLSRALNRGYGMSRYRWPMHFGLLNNDALWVMDETQLMGVSVETSAQLDGFRSSWPVFSKCPTWWMSATLDNTRRATVDHPLPAEGWPRLELSDAEKAGGRPRDLFEARKAIAPCALALSPATKGDYAKNLASIIAEKHHPGTLTLVVVNRVSRAQEIYAALIARDKKSRQSLCDAARVALVHSRFRRGDRSRHEELLFGEGDRIVIATQAVEAGVDVSARLLITELAPWSSLVQRMGRCNRRAEFTDAEVLWVNIEPDAKGELLRPYTEDDIDTARTAVATLTDASPHALSSVSVPEIPVIRPVIRRRDLVDLFDTTPDICGQDLDISRYIRDGEDSDVQFFWRAIGDDGPGPDEKPPHRDELCRVSIVDAAKFLKTDKPRAWRWNPLDEEWVHAKSARPGAVYLVDAKSGGYSDDLGWTGDAKDLPTPHRPAIGENESYQRDRQSFARYWMEYDPHVAGVCSVMQELSATLHLPPDLAETLQSAARWHDAGKAHPKFQAALRHGDPAREGTLWAKSAGSGKCARSGFRHELASALAWLFAPVLYAPGLPGSDERNLIAYLIAAHHGKVRLSIRSLPDEKGDEEQPDRLFARGVWDGETIGPIPGLCGEAVPLHLTLMQMGEGLHGPSWLARTTALRDSLGPFHLAFLETLLRAADMRTSAEEAQRLKPQE
jgi:CRISPR-associated endonuclease/helicase Cas3